MEIRVGLGRDIHRLAAGRPLVIGGVSIEHDRGAVGHSDADVLLHAVTDALLGAAGLGDIGQRYPDSDPRWAGADSQTFVRETVELLTGAGWAVVNLDCTVIAERPKLAAYKGQIRERLAQLLGVAAEAVNVKAKTGEKVGPVGREEALAAEAVVLIQRDTKND